jgi:hypothetical protein
MKKTIVIISIIVLFSLSAESCSKNAKSSVPQLSWQEFRAIYYDETLPASLKIGDKAVIEFTITAINTVELANRTMYRYFVTAADDVVELVCYDFFEAYPEILEKGEMNEAQKVELTFEITENELLGGFEFTPLEIKPL